jgi:hypothetical protein
MVYNRFTNILAQVLTGALFHISTHPLRNSFRWLSYRSRDRRAKNILAPWGQLGSLGYAAK